MRLPLRRQLVGHRSARELPELVQLLLPTRQCLPLLLWVLALSLLVMRSQRLVLLLVLLLPRDLKLQVGC